MAIGFGSSERLLLCGCHAQAAAMQMLGAFEDYLTSRGIRLEENPARLGLIQETVDMLYRWGVCRQCAVPHGIPQHRCWDGDHACLTFRREVGKAKFYELANHVTGGDCICVICRPPKEVGA